MPVLPRRASDFAFVTVSINDKCETVVKDWSNKVIQMYDERSFPRHDRTVNALLIEFSGRLARRIAVAQFHYRLGWKMYRTP